MPSEPCRLACLGQFGRDAHMQTLSTWRAKSNSSWVLLQAFSLGAWLCLWPQVSKASDHDFRTLQITSSCIIDGDIEDTRREIVLIPMLLVLRFNPKACRHLLPVSSKPLIRMIRRSSQMFKGLQGTRISTRSVQSTPSGRECRTCLI